MSLNDDAHDGFDKELLSANLVGAKTLEDLFRIERDIASVREIEIRKYGVAGNFDYEHLRTIHRELFGNIYTWAGQDRFDMGLWGVFRKGGTEFVPAERLPDASRLIFSALEDEKHFRGLGREAMIKGLARFLNDINILHPFREGNGRTQRLFIEELAKSAGYELDFSSVPRSIMIQASIQGAIGNLKGYEVILRKCLKCKPAKIEREHACGPTGHPSSRPFPFRKSLKK